jgi:hypothetical protein
VDLGAGDAVDPGTGDYRRAVHVTLDSLSSGEHILEVRIVVHYLSRNWIRGHHSFEF